MPRNTTVIYTCDVCGNTLQETDFYAFAVSFSIPGKNSKGKVMKCFQHPDEQPIGCTPEHAAQAAKKHIDDMLEMRKVKAEQEE